MSTFPDALFHPPEPVALWRHFAQLVRIPRPSKGERRVIDHVTNWARLRHLECASDPVGNLRVSVPATYGRGEAAPVVLQAHLDMVCERDPDSPFDAAEGRLQLEHRGEWLTAVGTTLGADNGIGVAAMMAVADTSLEAAPDSPLV